MQSTKLGLAETCLTVCMVSLSPLIVIQGLHLWDRPHFQFYPLAWLACGYFAYKWGSLGWSENLWRQRWGLSAWMVGILATVTAAFFFSPWIGQAAAILCITGWGLLRLEAVHAFRWLSWTLLLWITLPLPDNLDGEMINGLQRLSAQSASQLLDLIGILHLPQGTVLEIRSRQLFVDEACSGIDSLYSLTAIALLMMIWQGRPLIVGLFTIMTVPVWAWLGNVLRLFIIAVLLDQWQIDLSHGVPHTILGLCTFGFSSVCLLIMLAGFAAIFKRFSSGSMPQERRWHLVYNTAVCFPDKPPTVTTAADEYFSSSSAVKETETRPRRVRLWQPPSWKTTAILALVCVVTLGVNIRSVSRDWGDGRSVRLPHYELTQLADAFSEGDFPESFVHAKRVQFKAEQRAAESFLGEYSRSWVFRDSRCEFVASIDFPFRGYHPLWVCYTNAGKQILGSPSTIQLPGSTSTEPSQVVHVRFRDDLGNYSYLWFELFDKEGQAIAVKNYDQPQENPLYARLQRVLADTIVREPVSYQYQLYVPSSRELTKEEVDEYAKFFEASAPVARQLVGKLPM